jgi:hypothetical protein
MRVLKFIVDQQTIRPDPSCNFDGLIPGTEGYLKVEFSFSPEWDKCVKIASFWSMLGREYMPEVLKDGYSCMIPAEALRRKKFKMQVMGKKGDVKLITNKITITQNGGNT